MKSVGRPDSLKSSKSRQSRRDDLHDRFVLESNVSSGSHSCANEDFQCETSFKFSVDLSEHIDTEHDYYVSSPKHSSYQEPDTKWTMIVLPGGRNKDTNEWIGVYLCLRALDLSYVTRQAYMRCVFSLESTKIRLVNHDAEVCGIISVGRGCGQVGFIRRSHAPVRLIIQAQVFWKMLPPELEEVPRRLYLKNGWNEVQLQVVWKLRGWERAVKSRPYNTSLCSPLFGRRGVVWGLFICPNGCVGVPYQSITAGVQLHLLPSQLRNQPLSYVSIRFTVQGQLPSRGAQQRNYDKLAINDRVSAVFEKTKVDRDEGGMLEVRASIHYAYQEEVPEITPPPSVKSAKKELVI